MAFLLSAPGLSPRAAPGAGGALGCARPPALFVFRPGFHTGLTGNGGVYQLARARVLFVDLAPVVRGPPG